MCSGADVPIEMKSSGDPALDAEIADWELEAMKLQASGGRVFEPRREGESWEEYRDRLEYGGDANTRVRGKGTLKEEIEYLESHFKEKYAGTEWENGWQRKPGESAWEYYDRLQSDYDQGVEQQVRRQEDDSVSPLSVVGDVLSGGAVSGTRAGARFAAETATSVLEGGWSPKRAILAGLTGGASELTPRTALGVATGGASELLWGTGLVKGLDTKPMRDDLLPLLDSVNADPAGGGSGGQDGRGGDNPFPTLPSYADPQIQAALELEMARGRAKRGYAGTILTADLKDEAETDEPALLPVARAEAIRAAKERSRVVPAEALLQPRKPPGLVAPISPRLPRRTLLGW